jgi:hypothetical protein
LLAVLKELSMLASSWAMLDLAFPEMLEEVGLLLVLLLGEELMMKAKQLDSQLGRMIDNDRKEDN